MIKPSFLNEKYLVSDEGYVLSKSGKQLKPANNHGGYPIVNFYDNHKRKGIAVHTLVARAFCSGYKPGLTVNHKNGIKTDNRAENLEWVTNIENTRHAREILGFDNTRDKNTNSKCICAKIPNTNMIIEKFDCLKSASDYIDPKSKDDDKRARSIAGCITRVAKGQRKTYKGCQWEFYDKNKIVPIKYDYTMLKDDEYNHIYNQTIERIYSF